jgi:RNA polymerase sigma factor (sigma-70 family)
MATTRLHKMVGDLRRVLAPPEADGELLLRFVLRGDEHAFSALVRRHGAMVLGVCRRVLRHDQDAEDAFQATFLVLARKARAVQKREAVSSWLYAVAFRTAQQLRAAQARRRARERQVEVLPEVAMPAAEIIDWRLVLDHELNRLPERYRAAVVLCDVRGEPRRAAALQLGLSDGTLSRRLTAGRRLLAERLIRRGVTLSTGALVLALAREASAAVPVRLTNLTVRAAVLVAAGRAAVLTTPAVFLMHQVLRSMLMTKLRMGVVLLLVAVCGAGVSFQATGQAPRTDSRSVSEIELLRREIELLRLRLERVQDQVKSQQAELEALRVATAPKKGPADEQKLRESVLKQYQNFLGSYQELGIQKPGDKNQARQKQALSGAADALADKLANEFKDEKQKPRNFSENNRRPGPTLRAGAAIEALRAAKDRATLERAVEDLEQALREIRQQLRNNPPTKPNQP